MSASPELDRGHAVHSDHQHVAKISTPTTLFILTAVALLLYEIQWILPPFVIAAVLAYICSPLIEWLTGRTKLPRALFAFVTFFILFVLAGLIAFLGVPPLLRELPHVVTDFQSIIEMLTKSALGDHNVSLFGQSFDAAGLAQAAGTGVRQWFSQATTIAFAGAAVFGTAFGSILTLVLLCYFLLDGPSIARGLLWLVPPQQRPLIAHICSQLDPILKRYFIGVLIVVAYASSAAYIGLGLVLGIPHATLLALLTGILEMIPMVGPAASAVLAGLVAVHYATGFGPIIAYALYATALRLSIDQVFGPLALGTAAHVHPVLIIFCFMTGGILFGVVGVILAVPAALVVRVTLALLYDEPLQVRPGKPERSA